MSIKKILVIGIILSLLTVGVASAASVMDQTDDLILKNGYQSVASDNQYIKNYTKGSDNLIVGHIMNHTLTLDELQDGFSEKTINNTVGFYKENSTGCYFNYNNGNDVILIRATDSSIIDKIVLGNG